MSRKRLVDQVVLRVRNLERSKEFYRAVAETLGHTILSEEKDRFFIDGLEITQNTEPTQSVHLSLKAPNPATVNLFHEAALRCGGRCVIAPVITSADQSHYKALVTDPDGNNVEVIYRR